MKLARHLLFGAIAIQFALAAASSSATAVLRYNIEPGGQYTYLPSPEGPGVPGCDPSNFECGFGIEGRLSVHYDRNVGTAQLIDLDLVLLGNEDIQNNPPGFVPVTADRVADWLADRLFERLPVGAPIDFYVDPAFPNLGLTNFLNGTIWLAGGYDARLIDGDGVSFDLRAVVVPEPRAAVLAGGAMWMALSFARRCLRKAR